MRVSLPFPPSFESEDACLTYGGEVERVDLDTKGGNVLLLELSSQVTLDESGLSKQTSQRMPYKMERYKLQQLHMHRLRTFPVPPSPTRTSLKVGVSAIVEIVFLFEEKRSVVYVKEVVCWKGQMGSREWCNDS